MKPAAEAKRPDEDVRGETQESERREKSPPAPEVESSEPIVETAAEVEAQERQAREHEKGLIARFQSASPDTWKLMMTNRLDMLERARKACISLTVPEDWTLFKGPDGDVVGVPRKSGCIHMRKIMGITPFNYRPKNARGDCEPEISFEDKVIYEERGRDGKLVKHADGKKVQVAVVTMLADGYCHYTGETLEDVRNSVRSDESFVGRGTVQDLIQSCRTGLDSKITRILADTVKVPENVLKDLGVNTERCYKGHGYGTTKDREGKKVADEGIPEQAKKLGEEILKRTNGDKEAAAQVLVDITKNPEKDFKGFNSVARFTKQWQIDQARERLKSHQMFGDEKGDS